ncbi:MAG: DUF6599 family protein [Armatimonadota bacterium]
MMTHPPCAWVQKYTSAMKRAIVLIICATLLLTAMPSTAAATPDADTLSAAVVTACGAVPDVSMAGQPVTLDTSEQLAQHDPALAEIVSSYRFQYALQAFYTVGTTDETNCLSIIRMESALDAFGPFSVQRSAEARDMPIPTSAYRLQKSLHIWRGAFYVKVCTPRGGTAAEQKAFDLVTEFMKAVPTPEQVPCLLRVLPWSSRQISKPKYYLRAPMGMEFLSGGVVVRYTEGESECRLLLMQYPSDLEACEAYEDLRDSLAIPENAPVPMQQMGEEAVQLQSAEHGQCMLMRESRFVAALFDYHDTLFATGLVRVAAVNIRMYLLAGE